MGRTTGRLHEIFSSFQGEGLFAGSRQIFLRLEGCQLHCSYCDSLEALGRNARYTVHPYDPRGGAIRRIDNPASVEEVVSHIDTIDRDSGGVHRAVSVTGGEPLLQVGFLAQLLPRIRTARRGVHLETAATLPEALVTVLPHLDAIAADVKVPSATREEVLIDETRRFLALSFASGRRLFVKLVVASDTTADEVRGLLDATLPGGAVPVFLQPVTPVPDGPTPPTIEQLTDFQERASGLCDDVRILPQIHVALGAR